MSTFHLWPIILNSVATVTIFLITAPSFSKQFKEFSSRDSITFGAISHIYEDDDGAATEESESAYRLAIKPPRFFLLGASILGFAISLASAILSTIESSPVMFSRETILISCWMRFLCWILILLLALRINVKQPCVDRHYAGKCGAFSSFIVCLLSLAQKGQYGPLKSIEIAFFVAETLAAAFALIGFLSFPRRPEVFLRDGRVVDRERSVSVISRFTFQWCVPLLNLAVFKTLEFNDLPELAYVARAKYLYRSFVSSDREGQLWKRIFIVHCAAFSLMWGLTVLQSLLQVVPQISMYKLLRVFESHDTGLENGSSQVIWCATLGGSLLFSEWVQSWLYWFLFKKLDAPIYSQLSALIFSKALRRKNVKVSTTAAKTSVTINGNSDSDENGTTSRTDADAAVKVEEDTASKKSTQATINLIAVDSTRVSTFCSMNGFILNSIIKSVLSIALLVFLIGWWPLLAGALSFTLTTPLTAVITRRYSAGQKLLMTIRDEKLGTISETLQGIRQIKFSAMEKQWEAKIGEIRDRELDIQWRVLVTDVVLATIAFLGPLLLSSVSLSVYVYMNNHLAPSIAFTTITVFNSLEATIALVPLLITDFVDAKVSTSRIHDYLEAPERNQTLSASEQISFKDASLAWPSDNVAEIVGNQFLLRNVNILFPRGELSIISGNTGSGKSLLLASLLRESELLTGTITMPKTLEWSERRDSEATADNWITSGAVAFVAQIPWIQNMSIKDNILFGLPMYRSRYEKTLWSCSLEHDLEVLPDGDLTEIGANGVNLSGGQRWRVALARALYSRADILVLDDIFSAVDAHVAQRIIANALTGELANGRTRILATHHVSLVAPIATYTVILADGTVKHAGPMRDLTEVIPQVSLSDDGDKDFNPESEQMINGESCVTDNQDESETSDYDAKYTQKANPKAFVEDEQRNSGGIDKKAALAYLKASRGFTAWAFCLGAYIATEVILLGRSWWIKIWTSGYSTEATTYELLPSNNNQSIRQYSHRTSASIESSRESPLSYYLMIYFVLGLAGCLANALKQIYLSTLAIRSSRNLFNTMTHKVMRMPLRWIDTVPMGRILNRFTADFNAVDSRMTHDLGSMLNNGVQMLVIVVAGFFVSPVIVIVNATLLVVAIYIARRYLAAARAVKRLDSTVKSPVFEQFGSVLSGLSTIRAFKNSQAYMERMYSLIDHYTVTRWNLWLLNRWLGFHMGMLGALSTAAVAVVIVSLRGMDAALAGFALSFTLNFSTAANWTLRRYANTEMIMNAVERVHEYSELTTETSSGNDVEATWPSEGRITVKDLVVGYHDDLPPVLRGVSFEVEKNQRIGVVGRTGAGKSSLMLALFRFLGARSGSITIDGIDISNIKLYDLRSRLVIIPQDPGLFSGTIRSNLDPFARRTDDQLRDALRRVHLVQTQLQRNHEHDNIPSRSATANINIFEDLSSSIGEGGLNLSQGQRQLLCLARALLSQPKIMVLDEATSAVDMQTDALIQRTLREEFVETTLIVIAHRLSTVVDFDRILLMSNGLLEEFGSPKELSERKGAFWRMVQQSGERQVLEKAIG